jgi:hypothetical protein
MPSDERVRLVQESLKGASARFFAALAAAADEIRGHLALEQSSREGRAGRLTGELGPFGARHVNAERLAELLGGGSPSNPARLGHLRQALDTITGLLGRKDALLVVSVAEGGSLRDAVANGLAEIGRAFAAARRVQATRAERAGANGGPPGPLPFAQWTRAERRLAPPLVVKVRGADLHAGGLAEFLDGRQKLVLVIDGEAPPAPLVRLITPGTYVLQTLDATGLDRLAAWDGPAIAAIVPESAARFVHDPAAGATPWARLSVGFLPDAAPRKALGGLSAAQQAEDLGLLRTLSVRPAEAASAAGPAAVAAAGDPADRLAAWLLAQADLGDTR